MSSEKPKMTPRGLIDKILEPSASIQGSGPRQQAYFTTLISLIFAAVCFATAVIFILMGAASGLIASLFILTFAFGAACFLGRSENYQTGSITMVSAIILGGMLISASMKDTQAGSMIIIATIVPALALGLLFISVLATIIISIITIIGIGSLPLIAAGNFNSGLFLSLIVVEGFFILAAHIRDLTESQQLEEIGSLRGRLEERVEERTRYTRIAAEIAQEIINSSSLEEVLNQTVNLTTARFGFSNASIYLVDETEHKLILKAAQGQGAERSLREGQRVNFGPPSVLGWVAENKQNHVITRIADDPLHLEPSFYTDSQAEIAIPILSTDHLIGVLDVQSTRSTTFDNETIVVLQMLANQISTGIQNVRQFEFEEGSIQEVAQVYLAGAKAMRSKNDSDVFQAIQELFSKTSYIAMLLTSSEKELKTAVKTSTMLADGQTLPDIISSSIDELEPFLSTEAYLGEGGRLSALPYNLVRFIRQFNIFSLALIPIRYDERISAILLMGTQEKTPLETTTIQPYINLGSQISTALTNIHTARQADERLANMEAVARLSSEAARARTENNVLEAIQRLFQGTNNPVILLKAEYNQLYLASNPIFNDQGERIVLPERIEISPAQVLKQIGNKVLVEDASKLTALSYAHFHPELQKFIEGEASALPVLDTQLMKVVEAAQFTQVAFLPIVRNEELIHLLIIGAKNEARLSTEAGFFDGIKGLLTESFNRIRSEQEVEHRLNEDEAIIQMSQEITSIRDLPTVYQTLHNHVRQTMGNVNFLVAIYDANTSSISIPYMFERGVDGNDTVTRVEAFPLGEGLTSIPIRTKQPLLLVEDTEKRAMALGAKLTGKSPRSWMGTPMIVADEVIGAIVVQDTDHEFAFSDNDLRFLNSLCAQVGGTLYNNRLFDETRNRAVQLQTAAEIARDISGLLDLDELLNKAVSLICERFHFYHAAVFLVDNMNEYAQIREATGEAGTQMKRAGHKLKVGSKSIVGYVTGSGEPLIVNDTNRDATYFANPLLPETRAEVGIPLKVGQRILGALDVQSTQAFSFVQEDISVLRILADQMAIAVMNSELFADTQEHLSQSRLLHHVTTAAASGTTLEEALAGAVQGLQVTLGGDRVSILLADKDHKVLTIKSFVGYSEEVSQLVIPFGEGITGWVAVHQQPQRVGDVSQDPRYIQAGSNVHSELAVPLLYRGELLGVLNVESDQTGAYNENDEEMLGTLGGSLAAIIANARLIEQVRRQVDRERLLYDVTSKIRRSTDMQTIIASTATELNKALGARRTQIRIGTSANAAQTDKSMVEEPPASGEVK